MTVSEVLFETERLRARRLTAHDIDAMAAVYGDAEAMRWVGDGSPLSREGCAHWVEVTHNNYAKRGYGMFALELRATGAVIGFCGLVHPGGQPEAEIKYALKREFWGQGFASEAAKATVEYGAERLGLQEIIATVAPANLASQRVLIKAGLQPTETRQNDDGTLTVVLAWRLQPNPQEQTRCG